MNKCSCIASPLLLIEAPGGLGDLLLKVSCCSVSFCCCCIGSPGAVGSIVLMPGTSSCTQSQACRVHLNARMVMGLYDLWLWVLAMS